MPTMRKLVQKQFEKLGYSDITLAENGRAALKTIEATPTPFDLIISDWNMPIMTGIDLLKQVRAKEEYKKTPFIMLTSEAESCHSEAAKEAGVTEYLLKPFDADSLLKRIHHHFIKSA